MKINIQRFGRGLSAMVMPNIGAFIAWGLITAMFIPGGWWPNESIACLVGPMLKYLLPLLIAYTAGKNVGGVRGGVAGAVASMGVIVGSDTPMFIGAMLMGPIAGWCIKKFDGAVKGKVGAGLEMLVDNFSLGIIAMLLCIAGYLGVGFAVSWLTSVLSMGVQWLIDHKMIPLLAILDDPAKVLFLNNAVNHGIMTPLGIMQSADAGHSILFLVETNPGAGLGMLLACWAFGKGTTRQSAPGAALIQVVGGIHEIYFPYVLARPLLLLPIIAANVCALSFYMLFDGGLVAPASPGSIISIILMSPRGHVWVSVAGVVIATAVSFLLCWPIVRRRPDFQSEAENAPTVEVEHGSADKIKICFACDAGMGSSALGATRFKARLMKAGLSHIQCCNSPVSAIPSDATIVVCQSSLSSIALQSGKQVVEIANFLKDPALDALMAALQSGNNDSSAAGSEILKIENIVTGLPSESKEDAIRRAGRLLYESGYVQESYIEAMLVREKESTTYMGMNLAIPHGTESAKAAVLHSGIVVLQYPQGVNFVDDEPACLVIGIAGVGDEHVEILAKVASALDDPQVLEQLCSSNDKELIYKILK